MSCEVKERAINGLSRYLQETKHYLLEKEDPLEIDGLKLTFPYKETVESSPISTWQYAPPLPKAVVKTYEAMAELFTHLPPHWIDYLKKIDPVRNQKGCDHPISLVDAAFFTVMNNPQRVKEINLPTFSVNTEGEPDFSDKELVTRVIDGILNDPVLKEKMTAILIVIIPDVSSGILRYEPVVTFLKKRSFQGKVLDLGCGMGERTVEWQNQLSQVIGIDRQLYPEFYLPWLDQESGAQFILADFAEGCPFLDNSIGATILESVTHHITRKCLQRALMETVRVLKPGGFLFVGPQVEDYNIETKKGDGHWRCFVKTQDKSGQWYFRRKRMDE